MGSVLYRERDRVTFFDPQLPSDPESFLARADRLVGDRKVSALTTVRWHSRSRRQLIERYGASISRARDVLEPGIVPLRFVRAQETIFYLPEPRALIPGDRILGAGRGRLRLCPQSWLEYLPSKLTVCDLAALLRPLLELPVEMVLVSHGEPVMSAGRRALSRALDSATS